MATQSYQEPGVKKEEPEDGESSGKPSRFHVNMGLIPSASLSDDIDELKGLGLDVFNQEDLEQGVFQQVDQAIAKEEEERKKNALKKELKEIGDNIKTLKHDLASIATQLAQMGGGKAFSSSANRRISSVQKQKEAKLNEMKIIEERKKKVQAMLDGKLPLFDDKEEGLKSVLGSTGNAEKDNLIRQGQMTPFGTVVPQHQHKEHTETIPAPSSTDSEVVKREPSPDVSEPIPDNSDSDHQDETGNDRDWVPSDADPWGDSDMEVERSGEKVEHGKQDLKQKLKNKNWNKKFNRPVYRSDDDSDSNMERLPRAKAIRKYRDDGCDDFYEERMEHLRDTDLQKQRMKEAGRLSDSESEEEFDGGLKVPGRIWSKLYKYQKTCVKWLWELHCQEAGGIVGDEMGLGKTIQAIAFLAGLRYSRLGNKNFSHRGLGPCMVVCPATVMHQWVKEFHTWWPYFRVNILHSSGTYTGKDRDLIRTTVKHNGILVTSYTTLVLQKDNLLPYNWHYIVLDEGHKIRNPDAQATLVCKQFRTPHRIILSGSPIQNNLRELWSLMDFVFPGKLGTLPDFMQHFAVPIVQGGYSNASEIQVQTAYKCACVLRDTINPYLLRRMKADVKMTVNLPGKNEQVLFCRLTQEQREVYTEYLSSHECSEIMSGRFAVFAGLIQLRKICNHPDLSTGGPRVFGGYDTGNDPTMEYGFWKRAGKMIVIEALLKLWKKQGHKVLLFTQSSQMLDILESFVQRKGYTYVRMDGSTGISSRQPLVQKFNTDPNLYLFLLTTRVGGLGINLVGANRIILYDPDWNPSTDMQARERAWRIGQKRHVTIYRLLTAGTIEEKIYHRQIFKQFLTNRVLKDPKQRRLFKTNDLYELFNLDYSDDKRETETAALFAGTGSNVNVKLKSDNRFDRMRKEKAERQLQDDDEAIEQETGAAQNFNEDEIKRMRELAKMLSRKMEKEKLAKKNKESATAGSDSGSDSRKSKVTETSDSGKKNSESENPIESKADKLKHYKIKKKSSSCADLTSASANPSGSSSQVKKNSSQASMKVFTSANKHSSSSTRGHSNDSVDKNLKRHREEDDRRHKHKKKKHKKDKDAKFEGERIPHLVKSRDYKGTKQEEKKEQDNEMMDNYVLKKLFKKTGIQGALKHDKIMDPGKADYVIVESEAEKVAKEASQALKRSKSQCLPATAGIPTWTGSHGGTAKRPRFGQKKNTALSGMDAEKPVVKKVVEEPKKIKEQHFDGSLAGSVQTNIETGKTVAAAMSSTDLLNKMRVRNEVFTKSSRAANDIDNENNDDDEPFVSDPSSVDLIKKMQEFILFECANIGMATTQELLDEFGPKLPPESSAKFRAMLRSICDFEKKDGIGIWKLRREYR